MTIPEEIRVAFACTHALLDHRFRLVLFRDLAEFARRGIDRNRVLLAGFSRGGSMVWDTLPRSGSRSRWAR